MNTATATNTAMATRICTRCAIEKPLQAFPVNRRCRQGRATQCLACDNERKRRNELIARDPESTPAVNALVDSAPDPRPAIALREELRRQRDRDRPWQSAWPVAVSVALRGLPPTEAVSWRIVFSSTRAHWHANYQRVAWPTPSAPFVLDEAA